MKRIEHDLDVVIVVDVLAPRHSSAHLPGIVEADEDYVQILLVIAEIGVGGLGDRLAIVRVALHEACDPRHLPRRFAFRLHAQEVFQGRSAGKQRNCQSRRFCWRLGRRLHVGILDRRLRQLRRWWRILRRGLRLLGGRSGIGLRRGRGTLRRRLRILPSGSLR